MHAAHCYIKLKKRNYERDINQSNFSYIGSILQWRGVHEFQDGS
jgi:hypothetical protein